jgi:hypothetical protein
MQLGFEVLTAVIMESAIFRDVAPCSLVGVYRRFRGINWLHLQGVNQVSRVTLPACCLLGLHVLSYPEDGGSIVFPNVDKRLSDYKTSHTTLYKCKRLGPHCRYLGSTKVLISEITLQLLSAHFVVLLLYGP